MPQSQGERSPAPPLKGPRSPLQPEYGICLEEKEIDVAAKPF